MPAEKPGQVGVGRGDLDAVFGQEVPGEVALVARQQHRGSAEGAGCSVHSVGWVAAGDAAQVRGHGYNTDAEGLARSTTLREI